MSLCNLYEDWDFLGPSSSRNDQLDNFTKDVLFSWGYDPVDVEFGVPPEPFEDASCIYMLTDKSIIFNPNLLDESTAEDALDCALHEIIHAAQDQSGIPQGFFEELEAQALASQLLSTSLSECTSSSIPDSGAIGNLPPNPWESRPKNQQSP